MRLEAADSGEFLRLATTALRAGGVDELAQAAARRWTPRQLCSLLQNEEVGIRKLCCLVMASIGDGRAVGCLTAALRDADAVVAQLAEQALWSIWFRTGKPGALAHFRRGLEARAGEELELAVACFLAAEREDPAFVETIHQCAVTHYLAERWVDAVEMCERVLRLHPMHFGAMEGLGNGHFQLGNFAEAARWYRHALRVHPRMLGVADALSRIERCLEPA